MSAEFANNALFTDLTRVKQRLKLYNSIASGTAIIAGGIVTGITLTSPGRGYVSVPTVALVNGGGINAAATAIKTGDIITGFTVTNGGSGYISAPNVQIIGGGVGDIDDFLITLVNVVSSMIENQTKVKDGNIIYQGVFREKTGIEEIFGNEHLGQYYETIYYPIDAITSIKYTNDYQNYTDDYTGPFVKSNSFQVYLPNDYVKPLPASSKIIYDAGYGTPEEILNVALEMVQRIYDESGQGKNQLGLGSVSSGSGVSEANSIIQLDEKWLKVIEPFKKPLITKSMEITR